MNVTLENVSANATSIRVDLGPDAHGVHRHTLELDVTSGLGSELVDVTVRWEAPAKLTGRVRDRKVRRLLRRRLNLDEGTTDA